MPLIVLTGIGTAGIGRAEDALLAPGQGIFRFTVRHQLPQEHGGGKSPQSRFHTFDFSAARPVD